MGENTTTKPQISVIIPALHEADTINGTIRALRAQEGEPVEIVVADGGSESDTLAAIEDADVVKVVSPPGRGTQMNAGAAEARGRVLLFLHADTRLPERAFSSILWEVAGGTVAGAFSLSIDSSNPLLALVAWFANARSRAERIPYGDQAQFLVADVFRAMGGFASIPIMEDVDLFRRLKEQGHGIAILPDAVATSSRRWDEEGVIRRTLTNWWLRIRYAMGASPDDLVAYYRPRKPKDTGL